jgi:hypothetical protein
MRLSGLSMIWERLSTLQSKIRLHPMHLRKCEMCIETLRILLCTDINPPDSSYFHAEYDTSPRRRVLCLATLVA